MNPERWRRIDELFQRAIDTPTADRVPLLERETAGDTGLRREVLALLDADKADAESDSRVDSAIKSAASLAASGGALVGAMLGPYLVERQIGRGGMGAVYLASRADDQYQKKVAIKLVAFGTDERRFRQERRILARLDHPYIARLIDGGSAPDGRPYIVMDYVEGLPLLEFADKNNLGIRARCELFRKVCESVSFAHQNLIVHADIKPSNILVTSDGTPKLLDFGISKLVAADSTVTATLVTPAYASPEHLRSEPVSTISDVYSLGVLLFELLTSRRLYAGQTSKTPYELVQSVLNDDAPPPSSVQPACRGDLDAIVSKALRKEPAARYASAEQLSQDVGRHLRGLPVHARRGTFVYRAGKFARRNWLAMAASVVAVTGLAGGAAIAVLQAHRADEQRIVAERERGRAESERSRAEMERARAESERSRAEMEALEARTQRETANRRFDDVRQLAERFLFSFDESIKNLSGSLTARREVVRTSLEYLDKLARESGGDRKLWNAVAAGYERTGDVQGNTGAANIGDFKGAESSYAKSIEIRRKVPPAAAEEWASFISVLGKAGDIRQSLNDTAARARFYEEGRRELNRMPAAMRADTAVLRAEGELLVRTGDLYERQSLTGPAIKEFQAAEALFEKVAGRTGVNEDRHRVSSTAGRAGKLLQMRGDLDASQRYFEQAVAIAEKLTQAEPANGTYHRGYMSASQRLAWLLMRDRDRPADGRALLEKVLPLTEARYQADRADVRAQEDLSVIWSSLGDADSFAEKPVEAIKGYKKALDIQRELLARNPADLRRRYNVAYALTRLGHAYSEAAELQPTVETLAEAASILESLSGQDPANGTYTIMRMQACYDMGMALTKARKWREAEAEFRRAISLGEIVIARDPNGLNVREHVAVIHSELGSLLTALGNCPAAVEQFTIGQRELAAIAQKRKLNRETQGFLDAAPAKIAACSQPGAEAAKK